VRIGLGHVLICSAVIASVSGVAEASQTASISARFTPEHLGKPTTVSLGFKVMSDSGAIPSPLTAIDLRYPANLGIVTSGLGTATCEPEALEEHGPAGCPTNSVMGSGTALARFQIGPNVFSETASLGIVAGPPQSGYVRLLVSATGISPVAARIVMSSLLERGRLRVAVPLVPSLPEGSDVAVVAVRATLGGKLTYYERRHGRRVAYRPRGIGLPRRCPKGGFRFAASFSFEDGSDAGAHTVVGCPN
jgi:hypothetical protein